MEAAAHLRAPAAIRLWQAILIAGLALLGVSYIGHFSPGGRGCTRAGSTRAWRFSPRSVRSTRAVLVRAERSAWLCIGAALLATACGDILFDFRYGGNPPFPSPPTSAYLAFYPLLYVGIVLLLRRRVSTFSASLWLDGLVAATAAVALGRVRARARSSSTRRTGAGSCVAHEHRLSRSATCSCSRSSSSSSRSPAGGPAGLDVIAVGLLFNTFGDGIFLYQHRRGHYVEGTLSRPRLAALARPHRARGVAAAGPRRSRIELQDRTLLGTPIVCGLVATGVLVAATHCAPCTPSRSPSPPRRSCSSSRGLRSRSARTRRLLDDSRREALDRRAHRPRQPAQAPARPPRRARARAGRRAADARALRPQRLQGLQRHVRPPRRRRAAVAARGEARRRQSAPCGSAYRHGRRRVLRAARRHSEPALQRVARRAQRERRGLRGHERLRDGGAPGRRDHRLDGRSASPTSACTRTRRRSAEIAPRHRARAAAAHARGAGAEAPRARRGRLVPRARVGERLGRDELEELRLAAELHDVGKLAIPDVVLQKPGPLDANEWSFIRSHTLIGSGSSARPPRCGRWARIVRSTHENWDGTGYPDKLAGEAIPLAARIVFACDAYSAMTTDRPYRAARLPSKRSPSSGVARASSSTRRSWSSSARCSPTRTSPRPPSQPAPGRRRAGIAPGPSRVLPDLCQLTRRRRARRRARAGAARGRRSRAGGRAPASGRAPCRSSRARPARTRSRSGAR